MSNSKEFHPLKERIHEIIFEADTPMGKLFDVVLMVMIVASVLVVLIESVPRYSDHYAEVFYFLEWAFTAFFLIEYLLRLYCVYRPWKYVTSFFGIIDLLAILPAFIGLFLTGAHSLLIIRVLRLLRVFRIFKLGHFMAESQQLLHALKASRAKITVFLFFVVLLVTIIGSVMYIVEGGAEGSGFTSIPVSIYWAIVTLTTVGFGDITPSTELGQFFSAIVMLLGYAVIAVPTGIVSVELFKSGKKSEHTAQACRYCGAEGHMDDAVFCKYCGERLHAE